MSKLQNLAAAGVAAVTLGMTAAAPAEAGNMPPTTPPTTGSGTAGCNGQPTCGGQTPTTPEFDLNNINYGQVSNSFNPSYNPVLGYSPTNTNQNEANANNALNFSQSFSSSFKGSAIAPNLASDYNSDPTGCVTAPAQGSIGLYGFSLGLKGSAKINKDLCDAARQERKDESNKASLLGTMGIMATVVDQVGTKPLATTFQAMSVEIPSLGTAIDAPNQKVMDLFENKPKTSVAPPAAMIGATTQGCPTGTKEKVVATPTGGKMTLCIGG